MKETKQYRSDIMRAVQAKNTKPEIIVRKIIYSLGYRYRLHDKKLPGNPDIVFRSKKKVIFVNGCFWHGHDCKRGNRTPKTNQDYWVLKIGGNKVRDSLNIQQLIALGWSVLVLWECGIKNITDIRKELLIFLQD